MTPSQYECHVPSECLCSRQVTRQTSTNRDEGPSQKTIVAIRSVTGRHDTLSTRAKFTAHLRMRLRISMPGKLELFPVEAGFQRWPCLLTRGSNQLLSLGGPVTARRAQTLLALLSDISSEHIQSFPLSDRIPQAHYCPRTEFGMALFDDADLIDA